MNDKPITTPAGGKLKPGLAAAIADALFRQCRRCLHTWARRDLAREPAVCPRCKSPYWAREKGGAK